jgi:hypothetical protein
MSRGHSRRLEAKRKRYSARSRDRLRAAQPKQQPTVEPVPLDHLEELARYQRGLDHQPSPKDYGR